MKISTITFILLVYLISIFQITNAQNFNTTNPLVMYQVDGKCLIPVDFNQDNEIDLVTGTFNSASDINNFINFGNGNFNSTSDLTYGTRDYPKNLAVADINNDGVPDILSANYSDSTVSIFYTDVNSVYDSVNVLHLQHEHAADVEVGFLNNDSIPDLAIVTQNNSRLVVFMGNGNATFSIPIEYNTSGNPWDVEIADVDNDNDNDIIVSNGGGSIFYVHKNDGAGDFTNSTTHATTGPPTWVKLIDMNGDNYMDVVSAKGGYDHSTLEISLNDQTGNFAQSALISPGQYMRSLQIGMINDDNFYDAVTLDNAGLYISYGDGAGGFTNTDTIVGYTTENPNMIALADLNNNGKLDIVVNHRHSIMIYFSEVTSSVVNANNISVKSFKLEQNYPNPFNPKTIISYQLPVASEVELIVFNLLGQEMATLISEKQSAGNYKIEWNAVHLPSSIYFYRLKTQNGIQIKKMQLIK